jgi:hypothetical protein
MIGRRSQRRSSAERLRGRSKKETRVGIGPEARGMVSGRIVVTAALHALLGIAAASAGIGPIVEEAGPGEQLLGVGGIVLGVLLGLSAVSLAVRRGPVRLFATIGAAAALAMGMGIAVLAMASYGRCSEMANAGACYALVGGINLVGIGIAVVGVGSFVVIRRARPQALRRRR